MKGFVRFLVIVLLLTTPEILLAQNFIATAPPGFSGPVSGGFSAPATADNLPVGRYGFGNIVFRPFVEAGFQHMSFTFNLPTVLPSNGAAAGLDLQFQDANMWIGAVGLEAYLPRGISAFVIARGDAPRNIVVRTGEQPLALSFPAGRQPLDWTGSRLEWWQIDGGLSCRFSENLSLLAGLKYDHLSANLDDPRDAAGNPVNYGFAQPSPPIFETRYNQITSADFQTKLWIPYLGVRLHGPNYRALVMWSPFASVSTKIPIRAFNSAGLFLGPLPFFTSNTAGAWGYKMFKPGAYLEGKFEYDISLTDAVSFQLWCSGSWLDIRGKGSLSYEDHAIFALLGGLSSTASIFEAPNADGELTRTCIAGGLSISCNW